MILVSACLLGINCRYDGGHCRHDTLLSSVPREYCLPFCPEQLGGLPTPRPPAEIVAGTGMNVLDGHASIVNAEDWDVTEYFLRGASQALEIARLFGVRTAVMKERSPSCGVFHIVRNNDIVEGMGITTALFKRAGMCLISSEEVTDDYVRHHCIWK